MPQLNQDKKNREQKYLCSNPNCRKVFSRPKIIKYYVCPTCQTLVEMTDAEDQEEIQIASAIQESMKRRKPKNIKADSSKGIEKTGIQTIGSQPTIEEPCAPEKKPEAITRVIVHEQVQVPQQKKTETAPIQQSTAVETKTVSQSSSDCQYGFGYLSQREKGEGIPDTCIECPHSIGCMLSQYYKKEESVKEIKKWYNF